MQDSKFVTLLKTLKKEEVSAFQKHLKRLYSNDSGIITVFSYFKALYPYFKDEKKLEITFAYRKIFGTELTNNHQSRINFLNILSDLYLVLKEFLICEKVKNSSSFEKQFLWMLILDEKGLNSEVLRHLRYIKNDFFSEKEDISYYVKKFILNYFTYNKLIAYEKPIEMDNLDDCINSLDSFYISARNKIVTEIANASNLMNTQLEIGLLPDFTKISHNEHVLAHLYEEAFNMVSNNSEESFNRLEKLLIETSNRVHPSELSSILRYMYNFVAQQVKSGKVEYWQIYHHLNVLADRLNVYSQTGAITGNRFINIITTACKANDFSWAEKFIRSQKKQMSDAIYNDILPIAESIILYEKNEFKKVISTLEKKSFKNYNYTIHSKVLLSLSYYNSNADAVFIMDMLSNFETSLTRNSKEHQKLFNSIINFIKIFKIILKSTYPKDYILQKIEQTESVSFRSWLLEVVEKYRPKFQHLKK